MEKMLINKEGDFIFNFCMRTECLQRCKPG